MNTEAKEEPGREILKSITLGQVGVVFHWRSRGNLWGRFGGGWNWKLGIQAGGSTLIVDVLVFSLRLEWRRRGQR